jgi:hypothetical protein
MVVELVEDVKFEHGGIYVSALRADMLPSNVRGQARWA